MQRLLQVLFCLTLLLVIGKSSQANDSIFVKFLNRYMEFDGHGYAEYHYSKNLLYIFIKESDSSSLKCFIIGKNKIQGFGKLDIRPDRMALRQGYWRRNDLFNFNDEYYNNDILSIEETLPVGQAKPYSQ